jgi:F-type H+-transporting ATPase subunit gamma
MANTIALLRRIRTAQNVSKTTRAMQMIAASKLKKAQDAALASRPYVEKLSAVTRDLSTRVEKTALPAYMKESTQTGKTLVIVVAPDKGLCGGLVTNLAKEVLRRNTKNDIYVTIGKKIESTVVYTGKDLVASFPFGNTLPAFDVVYPISKMIDDNFLGGKVDSVQIISTHFINIFSQKTFVTQLLPIIPQSLVPTDEKTKIEVKSDNHFEMFEPDAESLLPDLLNRYIEMVIYQEVLESYLSEQAARMLSMQNATNNAKDIIEDLKLEYNKTRQAKITSELLDITGGLVA